MVSTDAVGGVSTGSGERCEARQGWEDRAAEGLLGSFQEGRPLWRGATGAAT